MIDCEGDIFSAVATAWRAAFPKIYVTGEYNGNPPSFPCGTIEEKNNTVNVKTQDNVNIENHANLSYEITAYSNKTAGRKAEAKAIIAIADTVMAGFGFTRTFKQAIPNLADATVFRMVARYTATVDKNKLIYRG